LVYHNLDVFDSYNGNHIRFYNNQRNSYTGDITKSIKYGTFNGACSTMVRRAASPPYGFDEKFPVASDWLYWIEHLSSGGKIGFINEVLGRYRIHNKNASNPNSQHGLQGAMDSIETCNLLLKRYPHYKKLINYRLSILYRSLRKQVYIKNLLKSLHYNPYNISSAILLGIHLLTFKKIKF
jgi:hypothetical protein